jgi:hypothetical protein
MSERQRHASARVASTPNQSPRRKRKAKPNLHHVGYVVFLPNPKPDGKVGYDIEITGLTPAKRFENHKPGIKASGVVKRFGGMASDDDDAIEELIAEVRAARLQLKVMVLQARRHAGALTATERVAAVTAALQRTRTLRAQAELLRRQRRTIH